MRVTIKKIGDEFVLHVETGMGESPAGNRLFKASHPQQPFPNRMKYDDSTDAMKGAEHLQAYLDKDAEREAKTKKKKRR